MKKLLKEYTNEFFNSMFFYCRKKKQLYIGLYINLMAIVTAVSLFLKGNGIESIVFGIALFIFSLYIIGLIGFFAVSIPSMLLYAEVDSITEKVDSYFLEGFHDFDCITAECIPKLNKRFKLNELPESKLMFYWRYRVQCNRNAITVLVPIIVAMIMSMLSAIHELSMNQEIYRQVANNLQILLNLVPKSIQGLLKYAYILLIYFQKVAEMNRTLDRIELLTSLRNSTN